MKTLQHWKTEENSLTEKRNALCMRGASREEALRDYDDRQQANNARFDRITKNAKRTAASFK